MGCCKVNSYVNSCLETCFNDKQIEVAEFIPDEIEIQKWEKEIWFDQIKTREITDYILSNFSKEEIPFSDFSSFLSAFQLPRKDFGKYKRFQINQEYSVTKILYSGLMLGVGSNEDKLYSLFSFIDVNGNNCLSKHDLIKTANLLIQTSLQVSPESNYLSSLNKLKQLALTRIINEICTQEDYSQAKLSQTLTQKNYWFIFSSVSMRTWIKNLENEPFKSEESTYPINLQVLNLEESITSSISIDQLPGNIREEALSSSSDSNGPICLEVNISPNEKGTFHFYEFEDPVKKAKEFSSQYNLSPEYKEKLISAIEKLKKKIA